MQAPGQEFYDSLWRAEAERRFLHQHLKNRIFAVSKLARSLDLERASILDLGCGLGHIGQALSRLGRVVAMDVSLAAVAAGGRLHPGLRYCRGSALERCFRESAFDLVVASEVVEHLEIADRTRFLRVIWEVLSPGGHLILTTPDRRLSRHVDRDQPVENHLSEPELAELLGSAFEVRHLGSTQRFLPILAHRSRAAQALRLFVYEVLRLRSRIEDPLRDAGPGLYLVALARRLPALRLPTGASRAVSRGGP